MFEFGFGLSYTSFEYLDLKIHEGIDVIVSFNVKNTGEYVGDEIVQVYLGSGSVPEYSMIAQKQLCGFERIENIQPGEIRHVQLVIPKRSFMYWDVKKVLHTDCDGLLSKWEVAKGIRPVYVGASVSDIRLSGYVTIG